MISPLLFFLSLSLQRDAILCGRSNEIFSAFAISRMYAANCYYHGGFSVGSFVAGIPKLKKMNMFNMERGVFEAYAQWIDFEEGEKNSLIVIDSVKKRREKIDHTNQSCGNFIREKRYFATAVYINMVLFIQPGFLCCLHICFFFIIFLLLLLLPDSSERK